MNFEFYTAGKIVFGNDTFDQIGDIASRYGRNYLVVCGGGSLKKAGVLHRFEKQFKDAGLSFHYYQGITEEPGIQTIDKGLEIALEFKCDSVIAIGGGSVLDTGKAIAGLITNGGPLIGYLEGVGKGRKLLKDPVPFIAVPTTSGTGSEVTKNSVITSIEQKFKKSLRSEKLISNVALVDPVLTISLPPKQTATSGMDALTQLIESYVSSKAQPIPEVLAIKGIELAGKSLIKAYRDGSDLEARGDMAMASLLSGICLANSGLGAAHGIAASLGCNFGISHGLACAVLLPHVMEYNLKFAVDKFAVIGRVLTNKVFSDEKTAAIAAVEHVRKISKLLNIPENFRDIGITEKNLPYLAQDSHGNSLRGNPEEVPDRDIIDILRRIV